MYTQNCTYNHAFFVLFPLRPPKFWGRVKQIFQNCPRRYLSSRKLEANVWKFQNAFSQFTFFSSFFFTICSLSNWHYSSIVHWLACSYQGKAYRHKCPCCSFFFLSPVLYRWRYFHHSEPYCTPLFCFASKEICFSAAMANILSLHTMQSVYSIISKNMDKKWFWILQTMYQTNIFWFKSKNYLGFLLNFKRFGLQEFVKNIFIQISGLGWQL